MKPVRTSKFLEVMQLTKHFRDKFGVYPIIRYRRHGSGDWSFVLHVKAPTGKDDFYRMADTLKGGHWYIDNLKQIPIGTIQFETFEEVQAFKKQEKENTKKGT